MKIITMEMAMLLGGFVVSPTVDYVYVYLNGTNLGQCPRWGLAPMWGWRYLANTDISQGSEAHRLGIAAAAAESSGLGP